MSEHQVYTDPEEPGAPRVGDVVVIHEIRRNPGASDVNGVVGRVTGARIPGVHYRWSVEHTPCSGVRWPTPAELAGYQLGQEADS